MVAIVRTVYVLRDGVMVDKRFAGPRIQRGPQSELPAPMLNLDTCRPQVHPVTGQVFDSKSEFRKVTKALGLTEVGNEPLPAYTPPKVESAQETMRRLWDQYEQGNRDQWQSETGPAPEEHPDLRQQSMTILAPHGTKPSAPEMVAAQQMGATIREAPAPKAPLTPE